jgi:TDG/mug DNA glycosylase family protein
MTDASVPDILAPDLDVVFIGINPGAAAATAGHNFVGRSNRFWRTLHLAGFTPTLIPAEEDHRLLDYSCGLTAAVARPTRRAQDLRPDELRGAAEPLRAKLARYRPRTIAFLGKAAYAAIVQRREVAWGAQADPFAGAAVWVIPNPSGLNRAFTLVQLVEAYSALRRAVERDGARRPSATS